MAIDIKELEKHNNLITLEKKVMKVLMSSKTLAELCLNREVYEDEIESLIWRNYIPSLFIEDTITDTEAYICYNFNAVENPVDTYQDISLVFQIFCHKDIMRMTNGIATRYNAIVAELIRLFDDKNLMGIAYHHRVEDYIMTPQIAKFTARQVTFKLKDFSESSKKYD